MEAPGPTEGQEGIRRDQDRNSRVWRPPGCRRRQACSHKPRRLRQALGLGFWRAPEDQSKTFFLIPVSLKDLP